VAPLDQLLGGGIDCGTSTLLVGPPGTGKSTVALQYAVAAAELTPGGFSHLVRQSVERDGAAVVVLDSLNGYLNAMPDQRFLTAQLHQLLSYLNAHGVATFIVVAQSGMLGPNMMAPIETSYLADAVVMLRYFEHLGTVKKAISVVKKRSGRHEQSIRELWFDAQGVHLGEPLMHLRGILTGVPREVGAAGRRGDGL
jgi:circadian clock protein KaiC